MLLACLLFYFMNTSVYAIRLFEADIPATVISFVRIISNLFILVVSALLSRKFTALFGDKRPSLWLRALFGTLALMLSFKAISGIGQGESAFLMASSGVFVALSGPLVLGQEDSWLMWLSIIGSFVGVMLSFKPDGHSVDLLGRARMQ